ncbi:MAG TPA: pilus assembly protein [Candidatus Mediterraneibacter avicola]|nr:pilus assembly protein [Candidatus Mediterraneibacter avicola]
MKASTVIEMSYIMPVFLFLFLLIMYTVFYYHDKAVLNGAAAETAVLGAQVERRKETKEYDLEKIFHERTEGKLIFLTGANVTVQKDEKEITVSVSAQKNLMRLSICQKAAIVNPEEKIRWLS